MRILHTLLSFAVLALLVACSPNQEEASLPEENLFKGQTAPLDKAGNVEGMVLDATRARETEIDGQSR